MIVLNYSNNNWFPLYVTILFIRIVQSNHEFSLTLRKDRKYDTIKLSSEFRNDILTSLFKFHKEFAEKIKTEVSINKTISCANATEGYYNLFENETMIIIITIKHMQMCLLFSTVIRLILFCSFRFQKYSAYKYHWSGIGLPTQLEITPCSLDQLDPTSNKVIASYDYKDVVATIGN